MTESNVDVGEQIARLESRVDYLARLVAYMPGFGVGLESMDRADQERVDRAPLHLLRGGAGDAS